MLEIVTDHNEKYFKNNVCARTVLLVSWTAYTFTSPSSLVYAICYKPSSFNPVAVTDWMM